MAILEDLKRCSRCKEVMPTTEFRHHTGTRDKLDSWCKPCKKADSAAKNFPAPTEGVRRCYTCGVSKHVSEFHPNKMNRTGLSSNCHACKRAREIERRYGITQADYDDILVEQKDRCAICLTDEPPVSAGVRERWHIDHDHETGQVRGLLCRGCNLMLGHARENPDTLIAAAAYLLEFKGGDAQ